MDSDRDVQTFDFCGFRLSATQRRLFGADGASIELPSRAFDLLLFMVERPGQLLDKSALLKAVWPSTVVEETSLSQCIFAVRRALGEHMGEQKFIATVPGRGYQFIAPVTRQAPAEPEATPVVQVAGPARIRRRAWPYIALIALLATGSAAYLALRLSESGRADPVGATVGATQRPQTIAVLPFVDLSPSKDMEYFGDGIAEELTSSLSKVHGLRIVSRHSAFAFKGKSEDAREIGRKLGVETILEGSIRKEGDRIDIKVHLTRTRDGVILWGEMYDRHFDDMLDIQGSIAREVAATLAPAVQASQKYGHPGSFDALLTRDAEAYRAYLHGLYLFTRWVDSDPRPARAEFLRAVERDPQFAMAYAMLARTYLWPVILANGRAAEQRSLATDAINKALRLDPTIKDLWWVQLFFIASQDASQATRASLLERAIATSPSDAEAMIWLAHTYLAQGRRDAALQTFEQAYSADPYSPGVIWNTAWYGYAFRGDRQRMLELIDELERLSPRDVQPAWTRSHLASIEGRALDWDRFVARVIEINPTDHQNHAWIANDYASVGALDAALYHARMCSTLQPQSAACDVAMANVDMTSGDLAAARKAVLEATAHDPQNPEVELAQGVLQYLSGDCAGARRSIALARPTYDLPEAALDLFHYGDHAAIFAWCLRQQGETARVAEMARVFNLEYAPPATAGLFEGARARMAAASGDRDALVSHLSALADTNSPEVPFGRREPMIRPYLMDPQVAALLDKLETRRAEWRRILPRASTHIPIPGVSGRAGS